MYSWLWRLSPQTSTKLVALHIHHMMTLTNFIHFQRFQKKKTRTFEVGRRFIDFSYFWSTLLDIRQHTIYGAQRCFNCIQGTLQFSLFYFSRIERARNMSTSLWSRVKKGDCITFHYQPSNGKMVTDNNEQKAIIINVFDRNLHAY